MKKNIPLTLYQKILALPVKSIIILLTLLALILRLPLLNSSLWLDEAAQAIESARPLSQQLQIIGDFQPPLMHVLLHFWMLVSHSEWWMRLGTAVLPGILTVIGTYHLGKKWINARVGILAAVLLATSAFHIYFSQELRPYALPAAAAIWSWWSLAELLSEEKNSNSDKSRSWKFLTSFVLLSLAGLYSSYLYPFVVFSQFLYWLFLARKQMKNMFIAGIGIGIGFAPWMPTFLEQFRTGQGLRTLLPGWENVVGFTQTKALGLVVGKFIWGQLDLQVTPLFIGGTLFVLALLLIGGLLMLQSARISRNSLMLLFCWGILPILLSWLVSFWVPILQPKRVMYCLPALYILLAASIDEIVKKWKSSTFLPYGMLLILFFIQAFGVWSYWTKPELQREDWRSIHQYVTEHFPPNQTVVTFSFNEPFAPWIWYDQNAFATLNTGTIYTTKETDLTHLRKLQDFSYVISFDYLQDLTDPDRRLQSEIEKYGFKEQNVLSPTTPVGQVRIYARPSTVIGLGYSP